MPVKHTPTEAVAITVAAMKKTGRILLPIGIAVLVTGTGGVMSEQSALVLEGG